MPLNDGYGVLVGTLYTYYCDRAFSDRKYYHCNLKVRAGKSFYRCPIDLDSKHDAFGVQWRLVELAPGVMHHLLSLREGWHPLDSAEDTGALDYYRSPDLQPTCECRELEPNGEHLNGAYCDVWKYGTGVAAFRALEPLLKHSRKLLVFGEPFRTGKGVHNIHQNQGDPPYSRWHQENGPWQDGGVVALSRDNTAVAFLCKFRSQHFFPERTLTEEHRLTRTYTEGH
ncbi:MAG: DUF2278 family protein [Chlorobiaceae bacterium]